MIYSKEELKDYKGFQYVERNGLRFFPLEGMPRNRWLELRGLDGACGGSDIGTILGWNYRMSKLELFYQKIGLNFKSSEEHTQYTYWGTHIEEKIMYTAQFYDFNDPDAYMHNQIAGIQMRDITPIKFSIRNPEIPFINVNIDGAIDYNPDLVLARRIAESKTITPKSAEMWESIPPYHLGQVLVYSYVLKPMLSDQTSEIYYLEGGNKFYGVQIPMVESMIEIIMRESQKFYDKVVKGIEIVSTTRDINKREHYLQEIEPDPDDTKAYESFMKESYLNKAKFVKIKGDEAILETARKYKSLDATIKKLESEMQFEKNKIWQTLRNNDASVIELSDGGRITFNKRLYVTTKSE